MMIIRTLYVAGAAGLIALIYWAIASDGRQLGAVLAAMAREPWTVVALVDLYLGFFVFGAVIMLFERRTWVGVLWALPVFVLGNLWAAIWLAVRLPGLAARLRS